MLDFFNNLPWWKWLIIIGVIYAIFVPIMWPIKKKILAKMFVKKNEESSEDF